MFPRGRKTAMLIGPKCCNPLIGGGGGWGVFNSLFGWTNSATYGTVISYNLYWLVVILGFLGMRYQEATGAWPFLRRKIGPSKDAPQQVLPVETDEKRSMAATVEASK